MQAGHRKKLGHCVAFALPIGAFAGIEAAIVETWPSG